MRATAPRATTHRSIVLPTALVSLVALSACASGGGASGPDPEQIHGTLTPPSAVATAHSVSPPPLQTPVPASPPPSDVADLVERVKPVVVNITAIQQPRRGQRVPVDPFEYFFGPQGRRTPRGQLPPRQAAGTGFIVDAAGYVVTNEHVVHGADEVKVRLLDDREFIADVSGRDAKLDLALLKLRGAKDLPSAALGSEDALRVGEHVIAVGNPFGLGHTVTMGIVSAKSRTIGAGPYDDFIQTDASINPGNSGGPLFNLRGEVVGINTAIRAGADGIGFATPVDALTDVMDQLKGKGYVERGKLGLAFQPIDSTLARALGLDRPHGALVTEVDPASAAGRAGIRAGDIIVAIDGTAIQQAQELPRNVARHAPGTTIQVGLVRRGKPLSVKAKLDKLDDDSSPPPARRGKPHKGKKQELLGIELEEAPGKGVRIVGMDAPHGPRGLRVGDLVVEVNRKPVKSISQLQRIMAGLGRKGIALFRVKRGSRQLYVGVPLGG